jgi:hypothetical protein
MEEVMITKYVVGGYYPSGEKIVKVEAERETEKCVWIKGSRCSKRTEHESYFDTWADAKSFLLGNAANRLQSARRHLEGAQGDYGNIKGLKEKV